MRKHRYRRMCCLLLAGGLAASALHAQTKSGDERDLLQAMHVDPATTAVTYQDAHGKPIDFAQFKKLIAHGSFDLSQNSKMHTAVARVQAPGARHAMTAPQLKVARGQPVPAAPQPQLQAAKQDDRHGYQLISAFFATCSPCIEEVPQLNAYMHAHPQMRVLAVTFDDRGDAETFVRQHHLQWPVAYGAQAWLDQLGIKSYPTLLLVDPAGKLVATRSGLQTETFTKSKGAKQATTQTGAPQGDKAATLDQWVKHALGLTPD